MLYLDANATEPLHPKAREAALAAMTHTGNPASIHRAGRAARRILEDARETLGALFKARPQEIVFTSGATEANTLAIQALGAGRPILIGATEHDSVRAVSPEAIPIAVTPDGRFDPAALENLLQAHPEALVCLMAANNETGVLHDLAAAGALCARYGALLHVDAVQAAARARADWLGLGASAVAISGHKAGGMMGAGALLLAPAQAERLRPIIKGGGQEQGRRGGTPALPAIAAMAAALALPYDPSIARLRDDMARVCEGFGATVIGKSAPRLPNTLCLGLPGVRAETQVIALDLAGIAVSAGAACSSGKVAQSHVLLAMGLGELAGQAIRVSLPWNTEPEAVSVFTAAYRAMRDNALRGAAPLISERRNFA